MSKRILIFGVGVIGSVYAVRLAEAGNDVTVLARGRRLAALHSGGLRIRNLFLDEGEETAEIKVADTLAPGTEFDAVLVTVRSGQVMDVLTRLQQEKITARAIENDDIRSYLLYHAALVFPLAGAMYAADGDQERVCDTRDAIVLGIRGCHECFAALRALGYPIEPKSLRSLLIMPERYLASLLSKKLRGESARVAMFGHANSPGGRSEIGGQASVLDAVLRASGKPMPSWDRLLPYFDPNHTKPLIPNGSREIKLKIW